jgi:hypothetical protein
LFGSRSSAHRPPYMTQCSLAVAMARLAAVRDVARDIANCSVGIVMGCPRNRSQRGYLARPAREAQSALLGPAHAATRFRPAARPGGGGRHSRAKVGSWPSVITPKSMLTACPPSRPNGIRQLPPASTVSRLVLWPRRSCNALREQARRSDGLSDSDTHQGLCSAADGGLCLRSTSLPMTASVVSEQVLRNAGRIEDVVARVLKLAAQHRQIDVEQTPLPLAHLAGNDHGLDIGAIHQ